MNMFSFHLFLYKKNIVSNHHIFKIAPRRIFKWHILTYIMPNYLCIIIFVGNFNFLREIPLKNIFCIY